MSFLNTIRGFGRSTKKAKKDYEPQSILHQTPAASTSPVRKPVVSGRSSPTKQRASIIQFAPQSPSRSNRQPRSRSPQKSSGPGSSTGVSGSAGAGTGTGIGQTAEELPLFLCQPFVKTALVKGSFKSIVQLPKYVDYGEWLSLNIFEMYGNLNQFFGVISEYVTHEQYPTMNAGPDVNYMWKDTSGQAVNLPASQYIQYVLTWISNKLNDQSVFPTRNGEGFPPTLVKDCKNIARQMFRIFAHIYHNHFDKFVHLSLEAHWNSFFAHFISFCKEFNLIERAELAPLLPLIENFEQQGKII